MAAVLSPEARACSTPVFRFALENWLPDRFEIVVFRGEQLTSKQQAILDRLKKESFEETELVNYIVREVTPEQTDLDPLVTALREDRRGESLPWVAVLYPRSYQHKRIAWTGPLDGKLHETVIDSPLRREIGSRLLKGGTAVWVLIESGNKDADEAAARLLAGKLEQLSKLMKPEPSPYAIAPSGGPSLPPVSREFSMVRLSRKDPAESFLLDMLLNVDSDLVTVAEPMAIPVFGRGRALYALIGKGLSGRHIEMACAFLVGACSCVVKAENPGADLLMAVDWDGGLEEQLAAPAADEPALAGTEPSGKAGQAASKSDILPASVGEGSKRALVRNSVLGVVGGLVVAAALVLILARRERSVQG
jgi:hypothetical protein